MKKVSPKQYALYKSQAQQNIADKVEDIMYDIAVDIAKQVKNYRVGNGKLFSELEFANKAESMALDYASQINEYIRLYSLASASILGDKEVDKIMDTLSGEIFGKTINERTTLYLKQYATDILNLVRASIKLGFDNNQVLETIRKNYKDPYVATAIKDANIPIPHYGTGMMRSAFGNMNRHAQGIINFIWGKENIDYATENGATGFYVHRGSSYPCATCDDEVGWLHKMDDPFPPYHPSCVCYVEFVYNKD